MTNYIKKITLASLCATSIIACKTDDSIGIQESDGSVTMTNVTVTPTSISAFDQGDTDYKLFSTISLVDKLIVNDETISVKNKVSIYTADFEKLGVSKANEESEVIIVPYIGEKELDTVKTKISVFNPIEVNTTMKNSKDKDSIITKLAITKDVECKVFYKILQPKNGSVDNVLIESKISKDGAYSTVAGGPFNNEKDSIYFKPTDFSKLNNVFYKVTATSSEGITVSEEIEFMVDTEYFGESSIVNLTASGQFYSLPTFSKSTEGGADIEFVDATKPEDSSILIKNTNVSFVEYTGADEKIFAFGDKLEAINRFNSGSKITQINPLLALGKVYIYKKTVENNDTYGIIKIDGNKNDPEFTVTLSTRN